MSDRPTTPRTTSSSPRRSSMFAPLATAAAGLVVGGVLVAVLLTQDDDGSGSLTSSAPDASESSVASEPSAATTDSTTVESTTASTVATTTSSAELRPDTARLDGVVYLETSKCMAFPFSNPTAGVGDAHVNVSLHWLESVDGERVVLERWNEDSFTSIGIVEPAVRAGRVESSHDARPTPDAALAISMSDGTERALEHNTTSAVESCPVTVLQGDDEFSFISLGMIDLCQSADGGLIATYQSGSMMYLVEGTFDDSGAERSVGEIQLVEAGAVPVASASVTGEFGRDANGLVVLTGVVEPGLVAVDGSSEGSDAASANTLRAELDLAGTTPTCTPAQEARFAAAG